MAEPCITQGDLESVANIYDGIRFIYKQKSPQIDPSLHEAFEKHVKLVMTELSQKVTDQPKSVVEVLVLMTKFKLFQLCTQKITSFLKLVSPEASGIVGELFGKDEQMYTEMTQRLLASGKRILELESDLKASRKETEDVLAAAETLEKTLLTVQTERDRLLEAENKIKTEFNEQIQALREENDSHMDRIIKLTKQTAENVVPGAILKKEKRDWKLPLKPFPPSIMTHQLPKELTLRQIKDFIEELYTTKPKYDQKFLEAHQPRETMEQHMMNILNQKYGLKTLIAEWVTNVVRGIQRFSEEDNDVLTFGKILKNEVEEEFRFVQKQVKSSISELVKMHIKTDFPYIQEKAAKDLLTEKLNGELDEEEWRYVITYMYNEDDKAYLQSAFQRILREKESLTPKK